MGELHANAVFPNITDERRAEFKEVAAELMKIAQDDPGTLRYDWFFNEDESRCVLREIYASPEALQIHVALVGDLLGRVVDAGGGLELDLLGDVSPDVVQAAEALQPNVYTFFQGK